MEGVPLIQPNLSPTGLQLLDRRRFLQSAAGGVGGVALAYLLGNERLLAADAMRAAPIRPIIRPEAPLAERPPHFSPEV